MIGRFTQEDTYREDGLNLYAYCGNNSVMYYDPSGYQSEVFGQCTMGDQAGNEKQMTPDVTIVVVLMKFLILMAKRVGKSIKILLHQ